MVNLRTAIKVVSQVHQVDGIINEITGFSPVKHATNFTRSKFEEAYAQFKRSGGTISKREFRRRIKEWKVRPSFFEEGELATRAVTTNPSTALALTEDFSRWVSIDVSAARRDQMPGFRRRKRRRPRRKSFRKRKRARRSSIRRRAKRRKRGPRRPLTSTRYVPKQSMRKFILYGQVEITSKTNGWGLVRIPMNTMERPMVYFGIIANTGLLLKCEVLNVGSTTTRRPMGIDRWLTTVAGTTTEAGHYRTYEVVSSKVTITHMPGKHSDVGANFFGGVNTYAATRCSISERANLVGTIDIDNQDALDDIYALHDTAEVTSLMYPGAPFRQLKHFNAGTTGTSWTMNWNQKAARKKNSAMFRKAGDVGSINQEHSLGKPEDADFVCQNGHFMIAQLAQDGAVELDFMVKIEYNCKLQEPTDWGQTIGDTDVTGDQFQDNA